MGNLDSVQAIYEAFGRGDVDAILDHLADDVEWDLDAPGYGIPIFEPGTGKEHARRFFAAIQDLEFRRFEPTNFLSGGNQIAVPINVEVELKATGNVVECSRSTCGRSATTARSVGSSTPSTATRSSSPTGCEAWKGAACG